MPLNKNVKVDIHISESGDLFINVNTAVLFISHLSDPYVSVDSTIELEKRMRVGKVAGIAATAALVLPQVALLGLIGGVRKQVNKETYILQVGTPNSGGAFLINEERDGRSLARLKERFVPEVTAVTSAPSTKDRLNELQTLLDDGLISNDEFAAKRAGIIAEM